VGELGKAFVPPLICQPVYANICAIDRKARNEHIKRPKTAIASGKIICAEGKKDCAKE